MAFYNFLCLLIIGNLNIETGLDLTAEKYIDEFNILAVAEMERTGIPASIKLAQAIVESNFGRSVLAQRANNHFGIKCKSYWLGQKYYYVDDDRDKRGNPTESCFRFYSTPEESFRDHSAFLLQSERYSNLFRLDKTDYKSWSLALKKSGYATDPGYANKIINVIERYRLFRYDEN